jgi:catechol 2,3-dioxygenase-like lactoylglutathione lyase family enzyme
MGAVGSGLKGSVSRKRGSRSQGPTRRRFLSGAATVAAGLGVTTSAQAAGSIRAFDHVAVPMRDDDAMIAFYRGLGLTVNEGAQICSVHFGDQKINLHRRQLWQRETFTLRAPAAEPPCGDFCFVWEGTRAELESTLERVAAVVIEGPVERQGGRDGGAATGTSLYVRDPDGNLLEFISYT